MDLNVTPYWTIIPESGSMWYSTTQNKQLDFTDQV